MTFAKRGVGVEVTGVPDMLTEDRIVDKLLIHFLRPRNGGGEVRRVIYPTGVPGQALIIFDEPDVASRVLKMRRHELDIWDQKFPVEVKPVDTPELDLPAEATLNVSRISDTRELKRIIHQHGFKIIDRSGDQVRIKGSMMTLRSLEAEIQKLLAPSTTRRQSPSHTQSPSPPYAESKNVDHRSSAHAGPSRSMDTHAHARPSHTPASSPTSPTSPSLSYVGPVDRRDPPSPHSESLLVNSDAVRYAWCKRERDINRILARHEVQVAVVAVDAELSNVTVTGRGAAPAAGDLGPLLGHLGETLHVRKVELSGLDSDTRAALSQRAQELEPDFPSVLVRHTDTAIVAIGPRDYCDDLKGRLLQVLPGGTGAEERMGRAQRPHSGSKRRSVSAPRSRSGASGGELAGEARAEPASLPYLHGPSPRAGNPGGHGAALTPGVKGQRGRGSSVTRTSTEPEETASHGKTDRTNSTPAAGPAVKKSLRPDWNAKFQSGNIQKLLKWPKKKGSAV